MPEFDMHNILVIPNRITHSQEEIKNMSELIQKNPKKRKNVIIKTALFLDFDEEEDDIEDIKKPPEAKKETEIIGRRRRNDIARKSSMMQTGRKNSNFSYDLQMVDFNTSESNKKRVSSPSKKMTSPRKNYLARSSDMIKE